MTCSIKVGPVALSLALVMAATSASGVAASAPPERVSWTLALEPASGSLKAGGTLTAVVSAKLEPEWHVYGTEDAPNGPRPLRIVVSSPAGVAAKGALKCPEPERDMDEGFGQVTAFYRTAFTCRLTAAATPNATPGTHTFAVDITFQACDGKMCLPARVVRLTKTITLTK